MTTTNTSCEVSKLSNRALISMRKAAGIGRKNLINDDIIYTTLKDCNEDKTETYRRLAMIRDIRAKVDIKNSVDDVYTMLKECNMDPSEATERLKYLDTFQEVKKKKDKPKSVSDGDAVQEVENQKDTPKSVSNGDTVQEVQQKKYTQRKSVNNGDTVQEVEQKKYTQRKSVNNGDTVQRKSVNNGNNVQEVEQKKYTQQKKVGKWDNQRQGAGRGNFYPSKVYNDAGRRSLTSGKECGVTNNHVKKVWRPVDSKKESNGAHMATSAAYVSGKLVISNGSQSHKLVPKVSSDTVVTVSKNTAAPTINTHSASNELKLSSRKLDVMQKKLPVSSCQSVIFPDHPHVPENCKSEFVFGSLAATRPTKPSLSCTAKSGQAT